MKEMKILNLNSFLTMGKQTWCDLTEYRLKLEG